MYSGYYNRNKFTQDKLLTNSDGKFERNIFMDNRIFENILPVLVAERTEDNFVFESYNAQSNTVSIAQSANYVIEFGILRNDDKQRKISLFKIDNVGMFESGMGLTTFEADWEKIMQFCKEIFAENHHKEIKYLDIPNGKVFVNDMAQPYDMKDLFMSDKLYYIDDNHQTIIFIPGRLNMRNMRYADLAQEDLNTDEILSQVRASYLTARIPELLPKYFKEKPLTDMEKELLELISCNNTYDVREYEHLINEKVDQLYALIDRKSFVRKKLEAFEIKNIQQSILQKKQQINDTRSSCDYLRKQYSDTYKKMLSFNEQLKVLEHSMNNNKSTELFDYISSCDNVHLDSVTDEGITITIVTPVRLFDSDEFRSSIYDCSDSPLNTIIDMSALETRGNMFNWDNIANARMVMRELFINESITLRMMTRIFINANGRYTFLPVNYDLMKEYQALYNPHLQLYNCLGGNAIPIEAALVERDYVQVIEHFVAACSNLNFVDYTVMKAFVNELFGDMNVKTKCIETAEGEILTVNETVDYLINKGCYNFDDEKYNLEEEPEFEEDDDYDEDEYADEDDYDEEEEEEENIRDYAF